MFLKPGGRAGRIDAALHDFLYHSRLVLAPGHKDDPAGAHHRADAHRDGGLRGDGNVAVEIAGLSLSGLV